MIEESDRSILNNFEENSLVLNFCSTRGWIGTGVSSQLHEKYKDAFKEYHHYCRQFSDGHENEILGTTCSLQVSPKMIICDCIVNKVIGKSRKVLDIEALRKVLRKVEHQTKQVNKATGKNWTVHMHFKGELRLNNEDVDETKEIKTSLLEEQIADCINEFFRNTSVKLIVHRF